MFGLQILIDSQEGKEDAERREVFDFEKRGEEEEPAQEFTCRPVIPAGIKQIPSISFLLLRFLLLLIWESTKGIDGGVPSGDKDRDRNFSRCRDQKVQV